ncbi:universal stress protein [Nocardia sp. 2]|uniref:Universal stress protein n=1 Tax=Nocardia acididurans TaxID=2802282 RepID=A0ABS1MA35_9NOCA|nr:universal stress protein [Nocardia acididurans]MBL1077166.1 universal stress protein [Nocardia acididurans]
MNHIPVRSTDDALAVAAAFEKVLGIPLYALPSETTDDEFLVALREPGATLGVVEPADGVWELLRRCTVPLVVVPADNRAGQQSGDYAVERVLVPLEGTDESVRAVARTVRLFDDAGVEIIVLHVFDETTVPAHWDQPAHERTCWERGFLARFCRPYFPGRCPELTLRAGGPGEHIADVAADGTDMIVLSWSRELRPGRARIVRETLATASVPVMLIPAAASGTVAA